MINPLPILLRTLQVGLIALALPAEAQVPNVLLHAIPAPGPAQNGMQFGSDVAVGGGYVVVGAPFDDAGDTDSGVVHVFDAYSGALLHVLPNPSPAPNDQFGNAVDVSGSRVVVAAAADDADATDAGVAYIFDLNSATPAVPVLTLTNPTPTMSDSFGSAVSLDGARLVVGAIRDDTAAPDAGAVYVYDLDGGTPATPVLSLYNPGPPEGDYFGFAVGVSGPLLVVGAVRDDLASFNDAGSAYVYDLSSGTPTVPIATLNNPAPFAADQFARSVAISGSRVVVGAWQDDALAADAGSVYIYDMSSGSPSSPVFTLTNPGPSPLGGDHFGLAVAVSGARVVVGAWRDDVGAADAGSAYLFDLSSGTPTVPVAVLNNPAAGAGDNFGRSVAFDGTYAVIGAPSDDDKDVDMGSAWVFGPVDGDNDGLRDLWEIAHFGTTAGHSALDDFDHDGICELLELALGLDPTLPSAGELPTPISEGGYLTMTITKQAGATYEVQSAGGVLEGMLSFSTFSTTVLIDNATTLKVRDNFLTTAAPARFMRVKVTAAP